MKTKEIPNTEEVDNKFHDDKNKSKKKFYILVARVAVLDIILYIMYSTFFNNTIFFSLVLAFSALTLIYRYLIVFHADKKLLDKNWENKKIKEYILQYDI